MDERFNSPKHTACLSKWLRPHLRSFGCIAGSPHTVKSSGMGELMGGLTRFYRAAASAFPILNPGQEAAAVAAAQGGSRRGAVRRARVEVGYDEDGDLTKDHELDVDQDEEEVGIYPRLGNSLP